MTASLAATRLVIVTAGIATAALGMALERLLPAPAGSRRPPGPPARVRSGAPLACRRHGDGDERRLLAAEHGPGQAPEDGDDVPAAPRSAEILPFERRPARHRRSAEIPAFRPKTEAWPAGVAGRPAARRRRLTRGRRSPTDVPKERSDDGDAEPER